MEKDFVDGIKVSIDHMYNLSQRTGVMEYQIIFAREEVMTGEKIIQNKVVMIDEFKEKLYRLEENLIE